MITFDEATKIIADRATPLGTELAPLDGADGRVLARPIVASSSAPPYAVSAMDGYAVRDNDLAELPACLEIIGASYAGTPFVGTLRPGSCVRIFTGARVPEGADRVVIQEEVSQAEGKAHFHQPVASRRHVRAPGSDFEKNDILVAAGATLNPQRLVAAAAADLATVEVVRQPRVLVIACGDELVRPGERCKVSASVTESLTPAIAAIVRRWHGTVIGRWLQSDDLEKLQATAADAVERADVVVITGGASVGDRDFAKTMFTHIGLQIFFDKISIKPGKPVWFGRARGALVMGLPGNPTSALVTARLLLAPLVIGLAGGDPSMAWQWTPQRLASPLGACGDRETFLRAIAHAHGVAPVANQDSAAQKALADAALLIRRRSGAPSVDLGTYVDVITLC